VLSGDVWFQEQMARYFKENVLYFFGNYYPRISLKDVEENHEGLSQKSLGFEFGTPG